MKLAALLSALLLAGCSFASPQRADGPLVGQIQREIWPRRWAMRTTAPTRPGGCDQADSLEFRCRESRHSEVPADVQRIAERTAAELRRGVTPDALRATALIDMMSGDSAGIVLRRSISYLEMATRLAPLTAGPYEDLSAARLAYAASSGGSRSLVAALDAASRAMELDSTAAPAVFDRALALERLGLDGEASTSWRAYLEIDQSSSYSADARRHLAGLIRALRPDPTLAASIEELVAFAQRSPGRAQAFLWEQTLGDWGAATVAGDESRARLRLAQASVVAAQPAMRSRDPGLLSVISSIGRLPSRRGGTKLQLARCHLQYAVAQQKAHLDDYSAADSAFREILAARAPSRALTMRAALGHANALIYLGHPDSALDAARAIIRSERADRAPMIVARARWIEGVLLLRQGRTDAGLESVRLARDLFQRAGADEDVAGAIGLDGEARLQVGEVDSAYAEFRRALLQLRDRPSSLWRHNILLSLARAASRDGLSYAARTIEDEDAAAVAGTRAVSVVEARLARARAFAVAADTTAARRSVRAAATALSLVSDRNARLQLDQDLNLTRATLLPASKAGDSRALLDSVIAFYSPLHFPSKLIPAFVARSAASIRLQRPDLAEKDLAHAAQLFEASRGELARSARQASLLAQARPVIDALVMLRIRAGKVDEALDALELRRLFFKQPTPSVPAERRQHGAATVGVDYALIGDTLLTWIVHGQAVTLVRAVIDRARLRTTVERVRGGIQLGVPTDALNPDLQFLYDALVKPVATGLGPSGTNVVIVPDDELADVPYAALRDAARGQYLIERYEMSVALRLPSGIHDAQSSDVAAQTAVVDRPVVFIADPALDPRALPGLPPLAGARDEIRDAAAAYRRPVLLVGPAADSQSVANALQTASVLHFAGHAVVDDAEPGRSYLAVKPHGLSAAAIAGMHLTNLRVVVLSACETLHRPDPQMGGELGLTAALLSAGAEGVVGTLWRINDEEADALMKDFHHAFAASGDAANALRAAQLAALHRPPRTALAWAAFEYMQ